ncbi:MAG: hypothetical protein ACREHC_03975 [Candidatus Levyibacteriota bacterium]
MESKKLKFKNQKCILFLSLFFILYSLFLPKAYADGTQLKISPSIIRIQAQPPADIHAPFTIENQSDESVSLKIGYKLFDSANSRTGTISFLKNGQSIPAQDSSFFSKVQVIDTDNFSHDTIELGPKQKKQLMLRITLPQGQSTTDYYFSLIFLENITQLDQYDTEVAKKQQPSAITLQSGIGLNVLLAVGPKEEPQATLDTYATPLLRQAGPVPFLLTVDNGGTHFINPSGTITIKNIFGQTVGKVAIKNSVILAGTSRTFTSTENPDTASNEQLLADSTIIWPEKFLLGLYTATINLSLSDDGPITTRTIHFMAFPLIFIVGFLIAILLLLFIYWRVKKKITER